MKPQPEDYYAVLIAQRNEALDKLVNALAENAALVAEVERLNSVHAPVV